MSPALLIVIIAAIALAVYGIRHLRALLRGTAGCSCCSGSKGGCSGSKGGCSGCASHGAKHLSRSTAEK